MTLKLDTKWVWDFWFAKDGNDYHIFYLQADRALQEEHLRHWHPSVGHAVSRDLHNWEILPDAIAPEGLTPEKSEAWDSYTTWTGSIIQHNTTWYMFYTGSRRSENGLIQRVGLATSNDLIHWTKYDQNPLMTADPQWYEQLDLEHWHDQAWRDPWIYYHPQTGIFHAYITARVNHGSHDGRGVIAHAKSPDLLNWTVLPPVTEPGEFGQMEVPQLILINDRYYLLFSTDKGHYSSVRKKRITTQPVTGTHYLVSDSPEGPFHYLTDKFFVGDTAGTLYSGKLIEGSDESWYYMGFRNFETDGTFIGEIADPIPVHFADDGRIILSESDSP